jgi:coenzyme Q-binding protein COQ10
VNKTDKIIIIFYIFLASSFGLYVLTYDVGLDESLFEAVAPKKITGFETSRLVDVPNNRIFDIMANVENFPNILPENVVSVNILSKTDNEIIAEEELQQAGIKTKLLVKHTIKPYSEHIIEIIDGDAEGTTITQYFESVDSQTKLTTNVDLKVKGVTSLIAFLPESNLVHANNTVISRFVEYSKYDVYEKIVDSIYQEILDRQADEESLLHFSALLRDDHITEQDLRSTLFNSEERALLEITIDDLDEETINGINDLYRKILLRESDPEGLLHWGIAFENGATYDEIRAIFLESDEFNVDTDNGPSVSSKHPVRNDIKDIFKRVFNVECHKAVQPCPYNSVVNHYHKMIDDDGFVLLPDWVRNVLQRGNTGANFWLDECKEILTGCKDKVTPAEVLEANNTIKFLYNEGIIFPLICDSFAAGKFPEIVEQLQIDNITDHYQNKLYETLENCSSVEYIVEPTASCLAQHWYKEREYTQDGFPLPLACEITK